MKKRFSSRSALHLAAITISVTVLVFAWLRAKDLLNGRSDWSVLLGIALLLASVLFVAVAVFAAVGFALERGHRKAESRAPERGSAKNAEEFDE